MRSPSTRPMRPSDIPFLAPRLRITDLREIAVLTGNHPQTSLINGYEFSDEPRTIVDADDTPIAAFGVCPDTPGVGCVWMLGTADIERPENARSFLRWSKAWVDDMQSRWPVMWNYTLRTNEISIRWLKWLGFEFEDTTCPDILLFVRTHV